MTQLELESFRQPRCDTAAAAAHAGVTPRAQLAEPEPQEAASELRRDRTRAAARPASWHDMTHGGMDRIAAGDRDREVATAAGARAPHACQ